MKTKQLVYEWFDKWKEGDFTNLPLTEDFSHTSPFGTVKGKKAYETLVHNSKDKFLGYTFEIHDELFSNTNACVRYTARQGEDFQLDVSEWYYFQNNMIHRIIAYYHIGEIREERALDL